MKKAYMFLIGLLVLGLAFWIFSNQFDNSEVNNLTGEAISDFTGEQVIINSEESLFEFTGGKVVGKAHVGTFDNWEGYVYLNDENKVTGIEGIAQVNSVKTDSERVDSHLQTDDFFDAENYPEVKFTSTNVDYDSGQIPGILEMVGKQKELIVPVEFSEGSVSGEFSFDADEFFKYDVLITEVGIKFDFVY